MGGQWTVSPMDEAELEKSEFQPLTGKTYLILPFRNICHNVLCDAVEQ